MFTNIIKTVDISQRTKNILKTTISILYGGKLVEIYGGDHASPLKFFFELYPLILVRVYECILQQTVSLPRDQLLCKRSLF